MREREIKRSPLFLQCFRPAVLNKGSKRRERERGRERMRESMNEFADLVNESDFHKVTH